MPVRVFVLLALLGLVGCSEIRPAQGTGAAAATNGQGLGEGPIGEVPTTGAFGPDMLSR